MGRVPGGREVEKGLREAERRTRAAIERTNRRAADCLRRGDYEGAEALVALGRSVRAFLGEVEALRRKWKDFGGGRTQTSRKTAGRTPLWEYYQPALAALASLGGEARKEEIVAKLEPALRPRLKPGDLELVRGGKARWMVMVRRARRGMVREGFLEDRGGLRWRITEAGRRAAAAGVRVDIDASRT